MDLSILIVNWNTRDLLEECLQSIYRSVKEISYEVIVVDNDSGDGSAEMIERHFPEALLIQNKENAGFAKGNNQAYALSKGRIIGLLNPDTVVYPGTFEKMIAYLDDHGDVGAVSCRFLNQDGSLQREYYRRFPTLRTVFFRYTNLGQRINERYFRGKALDDFFYMGKDFSKPEEIEQPGAACLVMRRSLVEIMGLFDEQFPIFFNDVDLCKRIWNRGYEIHVLPDAQITHYGGASVKKRTKEDISGIMLQGMYQYFKKHHGLLKAMGIYAVVSFANRLEGVRKK